GVRPGQHYRDLVAKADEEDEVHEQPHEPGEHAAEFHAGHGRHRARATDGGHRAFVEIGEPAAFACGGRPALADLASDLSRGEPAHLHRGWRHARYRHTIRVDQRGDVADG